MIIFKYIKINHRINFRKEKNTIFTIIEVIKIKIKSGRLLVEKRKERKRGDSNAKCIALPLNK